MDLFIENLDKIRKVVEFIAGDYGYRYETDELINIAYIGYDRAITNNPSLVYDQFNNIHVLINRVRYDILDYIRNETKTKSKKLMKNAGMTVPLFYNASFLPLSDDNKEDRSYVSDSEEGYEDVDIRDTLDYLMNNAGLTEVERKVIYIRYAIGKTIEETAGIMNKSVSWTNNTRKSAMEKIKDKIEVSCVAI